MNAQQTLDANRSNPFFAAMLAMGWHLTDGIGGPFWWRQFAGGEARRTTSFCTADLVDWLLNRPELDNEPRVLHLLAHQRLPGRAHHVPRFVARLNIHDGRWSCEANSNASTDEAVAKLVAIVAQFEAARR